MDEIKVTSSMDLEDDQIKIKNQSIGSKEGSLKFFICRSIKSRYKKTFSYGFKHDAACLLKNAGVLIIGNICQIMFIVMSTMFCGHLGVKELHAIALANAFTILSNISPIIGMAGSCDTLFPRFFGHDDKTQLGLAFQRGSILLALTGFVCSIALLNSKFILALVSDQPDVNELAFEFLLINMASPIFYGIHIAASRYLESQSILIPIVSTGLIANAINATLHAILIFYFELGIRGSAIANLIANISQPVILIGYIIISKVYKPTWTKWSKECFRGWWEFLKLGLPGIVLEMLDWSYFELAVIATGRLDSIQPSVTTIGSQIVWIASMVYMGLSVSGNILGGNYLGENLPKRAYNSVKVLLTLGICTSLLQSALIFSLSDVLPHVFTKDQEVLEAARPIMKYMAVCVLVESMQSYGSGVLKTAGAQSYAMMFNIICFYLIGLPLGYFFIFKTELKALGFFVNHSIVGSLLILCHMVYISGVNWKKTAEEAHQEEKRRSIANDLKKIVI